MKFGSLLKAYIFVLFALFAPAAFADPDPPKPDPNPAPAPNPNPAPAPNGAVTLTKEQWDELMGRLNPPKPSPEGDPLLNRAKKDEDDRRKAEDDTKTLESVVAFNMGLEDFVKKNSDLLPKEFEGIVKASNAENYGTASAKAAAVKMAFIEAYFSVQANFDCLTEGQKRDFDDYKKLTKAAREQKAASVYASIFEPTLEMNRRLRRAEEINRGNSGIKTSDSDAAYRDKMIALSTKKYLGK